MTNDSDDTPITTDDLAAYALDAHGADETAAIVAHLEATSASDRLEKRLRVAAGEFAAEVVVETAPRPDLRARVIGEARRRRAPARVVAGWSPIDVHRVEAARAVMLLRDLTADEWTRPVDPPEMSGWSVHDVAMHLAANESMLADALGVPVTGIPETVADNVERTAQTRARLASRPPAAAVAELEASAEIGSAQASSRGEARLREPITWWGRATPTGAALVIRAVETWTHADDIRRAVGIDMASPPPASMLSMAHLACSLVPAALAATHRHGQLGTDSKLIRFRFDDLDGTAWDVDLGRRVGVRPAGTHAVDAEITTDAVTFCRGFAARVSPGDIEHEFTGDGGLVSDVIASLPALAEL